MSQKRLAVVTGGARGIGKAIVMKLLQQGRAVAAVDLLEDQLIQLEADVKATGFEVITKSCDITDTEKFLGVLEELSDAHGGIGILVNNAGITRDKLMIQMEEEDYDKLMAVNLRAAFMATKFIARGMVKNRFGRIINMSSVAGVMGQAGSANYAASKAGLIGMSKSIAREVGKKGVTCNCKAPGFIMTEMTEILPDAVKDAAKAIIPLKRFGKPDDIANAVAFLASDEAAYITGQVLCVDGGMAM